MLLTSSQPLSDDTYRHRGQRRALVRDLRERGITDERVLAALAAVPRHLFFAPAFEAHAYQDKAFPIGEGQTISQPYTVAYQSQLLRVEPGQRVLEVGTGSGYQCAVLLHLTELVWSIEVNEVLFERTRQRLPELGIRGCAPALRRWLAGPARRGPLRPDSGDGRRTGPAAGPATAAGYGRAAGDSGGRRARAADAARHPRGAG